jgi:anti-sigma factor RsiW
MTRGQHLPNDVLTRLLDCELNSAEAAAAQAHVDECAECRARYVELDDVSKQFENFAGSVAPAVAETERETLLLLMKTEAGSPRPRQQKVLQRFAWGMALAASLALGLLVAPHFRQASPQNVTTAVARESGSVLEVDGESFVAVPYSNPDLPVAVHRIVQMQVPVSSLVDAGVHFESISSEASGSDESVLADVLLGIDGQPLGVHVLSTQYQ